MVGSHSQLLPIRSACVAMFFSCTERFFTGRARLLTLRDTFSIGRMGSFTHSEGSFTCRDRLGNVSGCILIPF